MSERSLAGRRVVVVGGSAGIGRAFAEKAMADSARLVVVARRELPAEVTADPSLAASVSADICLPADCARVGDTAARVLGEVDLLVITAGYAPLKPFCDVDAEDWFKVLSTNVIGVHQIIQAHLPVLAPSAIIAVMSSDSVRHPHRALGAYSASKAAMERSLVAWRLEHPGYRFSCVEVGATVPTDFISDFDPDLLGAVAGEWISRGLVPATHMTPEAVADTLAGIFAGALDNPNVGLDHVTLKSPAPPMTL
ncbi:SDR family oxidoreductase [Mycobacterium sp. ACS4331]|uniref:SDR family NAD(P)-dependent oxidoreductase n=1 Tax=Mycobacterium sp. ACS4331 TaxID=1834121 RepID=UPI000800100C|nr:SDR family oxidoreductase [Mycobacterium sp. ACS4331]OBF24881.1 short-chain dehydrogenase [Mycobacterium sp. ACS4331]